MEYRSERNLQNNTTKRLADAQNPEVISEKSEHTKPQQNTTNVNTIQRLADRQNPEVISEKSEPIKLQSNQSCKTSFHILANYQSRTIKSRGGNKQSNKVKVSGKKLSTEEIMRVAGERYIEFSSKNLDGVTMFIHPCGSALASLSLEEARGVDLAHHLLATAEKVGKRQFDSANKLLRNCERIEFVSGNPVERIAFHFSRALRQRMAKEGGSNFDRIDTEQVRYQNRHKPGIHFPALAMQQCVPFCMVMQFASTQIILDNVEEAEIIHVIDLQLKNGIQWTPLMQALSERKTNPMVLLKITALETTNTETNAEETGDMLLKYAKSINIPFAFKVVFVSDMKDLTEELFDIKPDEAVAVYSPFILKTMISRPNTLHIFMRVIERLRPSIIVVSEVEASHNSPLFANRFIEALFFFSAWFDALDDCMDRNDQYRMDIERNCFGSKILSIVATEGEERTTRSVGINVWRAFFAKVLMLEVEISQASLDQANLVLERQFSCASSCTIKKIDNCIMVEWKGTPMVSISAWKFK